jgi:chemotaxis protein MotB
MVEDRTFEDNENELNKAALWGLIYGDFMSYMMVFFMVLFAFQLKAKTQPGGAAQVESSLDRLQREFGGRISDERLNRLTKQGQEQAAAEQLKRIVDQEGLKGIAHVEQGQKGLRMTLDAPVFFDVGRAEVKTEAARLLFGIASTLKGAEGEIVVEGHTDDVPVTGGAYPSNWDLSAARANAVIKLFAQWGIDPKRLTGVGRGEYRPKVPNDSPEHRAQNRRIEINLNNS